MQIGKENIKLTLFVDDMILQVVERRDAKRRQLELYNLVKLHGIKSTHKNQYFCIHNSFMAGKRLVGSIPSMTTTKRRKKKKKKFLSTLELI